jgi:hypothetical protein
MNQKNDAIVRYIRFPDRQNTGEGEHEGKKALRRTLLGVQLHRDQGLREKSYGYIRQYY